MLSRIKNAWAALCGENPSRQVLPERRACGHFDFEHEGFTWTCSHGYLDDGSPGELFLANSKTGTSLEAYAQDTCVAVSIALQYGAPVDVIRHAMGRNSRGEPRTPVAAALDLIVGDRVYEKQDDPVLSLP